jgi:hypothetical protein
MDFLNPNTIMKSVYVPNQYSIWNYKIHQAVNGHSNIHGWPMPVLALNAGSNIIICLRVWSLYTWLHSHHHYHHPFLLILVLFPYQLPSPVCCPTVSAKLTTCVSLMAIPTFSLSPVQQQQVLWWSRDCQCGCPDSCYTTRRSYKAMWPVIICRTWSLESQYMSKRAASW